jgi:peptidoglycan/xylan/chitin deacetylase (PgdA/CDA1 family)
VRVRAWPLRPRISHTWRLAALAFATALPLTGAAWAQPGSAQAVPRPAVGAWAQPASAQAAPRPTVVTFTFDDGTADQMTAARVLRAHGLHATFYIITGAIGSPHYMTRNDLRWLASAGNEIGGHTVSHLDLLNTSVPEARRQLCAGRDILSGWGFKVTSFAYPDGAYDRATEALVRGCGYSSARIAGGLRSTDCPGCAVTESIPPADLYAIRTTGQVDTSWTLASLEQAVIRAEQSGGGWVPLIFHHVCGGNNCGQLSIRASTFSSFVQWLALRGAQGTVVRTVHQVLGSPVRPLVPAPRADPHNVANPSLEQAGPAAETNPWMETPDRSGAPACWMSGRYGRNTVRWQRTRDARSGRWAERLTMTSYHSGGAELLPLFDLGACSLSVVPGRSYQLSAWYTSTARTQFSVYYRDPAGRWHYWTSSPYLPAATHWTKTTWQTPGVPAGGTGLSYGLALFSRGTLTTDDYSFAMAPPDLSRKLLDWGLLAALMLTGVIVIGRRVTRRPRSDPPQGAGSAPHRTRPRAASEHRAS